MRRRRPSMGGWRGLRTGLKGSRLGAVCWWCRCVRWCRRWRRAGTQPYETYESTVAADGPVAQFRFDDAAGSSTIADSVGSYTATNNGVVAGRRRPVRWQRLGVVRGRSVRVAAVGPAWRVRVRLRRRRGWIGLVAASYKQPMFELGSSSTNYMYLTPASALTSHTMLFEIHTSARVGRRRSRRRNWRPKCGSTWR